MFSIAMALARNVFIRGLNSLHYNAPLIKPGDEISFVGYALVWVEAMHSHHEGEEKIVFPFLQTKFDMGANLAQHEAFLNEVNKFEEHVKEVFNGEAEYDRTKTRALIEAFGDILVQHLHDEIPTLSPERLSQYDKKELEAMVHAHFAHVRAQTLAAAVMFVTHHDFNAVPTWAYHNTFLRHTSYWQFAPFTRYGEPQKYIV
ncbi:hypothetical protein BDZ97DRAFT_1827254 [Flammula alnicola]|nr:hypothetical protein BDZ97DRAFT_1827254 [Flammula alnicola]